MDPEGDNKSLQRKVQFNIRLFFARRGAENMEKIQVNDFNFSLTRRQKVGSLRRLKMN